MKKIKTWIFNEFWNGYTLAEKLFMLAMVLLQLVIYCFEPDSLIGMICGVAGCICVVLTAKGKLSSYIFNFIQIVTYMFICLDSEIYLEFGEQVFYFIACIFGVFVWKNNMKNDSDGNEYVFTKKFRPHHWVLTVVISVISTLLFGYFGDRVLGSALSYLDAFTISLSVIAQLLMVWRYREQWAIWILIDVANLIMFVMLKNWSMIAMYIAWTINALYGWYNWTKLNKTQDINKENKQ